MEKSNKFLRVLSVGSVLVGVLASTCCILPVVFGILGVGTVGAFIFLEPLRPLLIILAYIFIGAGLYFVYRKRPESCEPGSACATGSANRIARIGLVIVFIVVTLVITFPYWIASLV